METLTDAMIRLRADGYLVDFAATVAGLLECSACRARERPEGMAIHATVRFEGDSYPGDEAILVALVGSRGCRGQYSAAYGPDTAPEDAAVLQRLSAR